MEKHLYELRLGTSFNHEGHRFTILERGSKTLKTKVFDEKNEEYLLNSFTKIHLPEGGLKSRTTKRYKHSGENQRKLKEYRTQERRAAKQRKLRKTVPIFLHKVPISLWKEFIGYALEKNQLKHCCVDGCKKCHRIGWIGAISPHDTYEPGNTHRHTVVLSAPQYGIVRGVSRMEIKRLCEDNKLPHFKLPQGRKRYVLYNKKDKQIFVPLSFNPHI